MNGELDLVKDLAVILVSAGIITVISKALKQPLVLGYIIVGLLVGPHIDFFWGISSTETVEQWSNIGIIFMMFGLGLEFSFKKLFKVGSGVAITAASKFVGLGILGFLTGMAMSWTTMESLFLAGLLSMSSTAIIIKSFNDMGMKDKPHAQLAFGAIIIEDLTAIILMVVLTSLAISQSFSGTEMLYNLGKLLFFIILCFLVGIYVIPSLFRKARKYFNDEILLIICIGLCFAMVSFAESAGFSEALGAFLMGAILSETIESNKIEHLVNPIKDLFGAIFFISVGMMMDPSIIVEHWGMVLTLCMVIFIGDAFFVILGVLISGKGLENAINTGFSLAQLGEFGFILAGIGVQLGVVRDFIYPVIVAVSVLTVFFSPYLMRAANPFYLWVRKSMPKKWQFRIDALQKTENVSKAEQSEWKKLLTAIIVRILTYFVLIVAVDICAQQFLTPFIHSVLPNKSNAFYATILLAIVLFAVAPLIYGMCVNSSTIKQSASKLLKEKSTNRWSILGLVLLRTIIAVGLVLSLISKHVKLEGWTLLLIIVTIIIFIIISRRYIKNFIRMERRFFSNFNLKEELIRQRNPITSIMKEKLEGYNVVIEPIEVPQETNLAGIKLKDITLRAETGASIIKIQRGNKSFVIPSGDICIYPHDMILLVGTQEQLEAAKNFIKGSKQENTEQQSDFKVDCLTLNQHSYLTGKTLKTAGLHKYHCMVVSVVRKNDFITNPQPNFCFEYGDMVWVAGEIESCDWLK